MDQAISDNVLEIEKVFGLRGSPLYAMAIILTHGGHDGSHHKEWVLDQVARVLLRDRYDEFVKWANEEDGDPNAYEWSVGIAP